MKNENLHAYSWSAQQRRARRERALDVLAYAGCMCLVAAMTTLVVIYLSA